jgi:hypothetical protein
MVEIGRSGGRARRRKRSGDESSGDQPGAGQSMSENSPEGMSSGR